MDLERYFTRALNMLQRCEAYVRFSGPGVNVLRSSSPFEPWKTWRVVSWRETLTFPSGAKLEIFEAHGWNKRTHVRKLKYHLMDENGQCVFRVDTHSYHIPLDEPFHIHIGPDGDGQPRLTDGDARLHGFSLVNIGFEEIFALVLNYIEGRPLPWQQ